MVQPDLGKLQTITLLFFSVMTYSQHTRRTTPGPQAGIPWVIRNIEYFLTQVPPEKLSLGIPTPSQYWFTAQDDEKYLANARSWSKGLSYKEAMSLAERFNAKISWLEDQKVPFTFFDNCGLLEYIFFENARSFQHISHQIIIAFIAMTVFRFTTAIAPIPSKPNITGGVRQAGRHLIHVIIVCCWLALI